MEESQVEQQEEPQAASSEVETPQAEESQPDTAVSEIEEKAAKMGWTPLDKFKGDPAKWRSADEYLERGENMLPIVRATVKRQEREIAELKQAMQQFGEYHSQTEQRAYEQALHNLKQQRADAIATGDGATFDRVDESIAGLRKIIDEKSKPAPQQETPEDPVYTEWKKTNSWIDDQKLGEYADFTAQFMRKKGETATGADFLELVKREVKTRFPDKFENPRRSNSVSVEGGVPAPRKGGKSFADLPAEARQACERMAKSAYSEKPKEAAEFKANYVKQYFEGE